MFIVREFCTRTAALALAASVSLALSEPALAGSTSVVPAPGTINVLHSFAGTDGANPQGGLQYGVHVSGKTLTTTLYGTAQFGGSAGAGTIFAQGVQGSTPFADVFTFTGASGATPSGGLAGIINNYALGGPFIGVTSVGGKYGYGSIYEATSNGAETVLYSFTGGKDGANPIGRLIAKGGSFYGTTSAGGAGFGTVFRLSGSGLKTIYTFTGGNDGGTPLAGLALRLTIPSSATKAREAALRGHTIDARIADAQYVDASLYGTTSNGGTNGAGNGTLFKISTAGKLTTLFTFTDSATNPGATPSAELATDFNGNLYGTTLTGGSAGLGEVFVYTAAGAFSVLHDFAADAATGNALTGANPLAPITVASNGALYGTTSSGSINGLGNVFEIGSTGFVLKYEFSGPDGATPQGTLVDGLDGTLYGTTSAGGLNGLGTIFNIAE